MTVGKYSPTVSAAYGADQKWHEHNGGGDEKNWSDPYDGRDYDNDGYDSYGYDCDNVDRAGNHEDDYMEGEWLNEGGSDVYVYVLYETVSFEWSVTDEQGLPKKIRNLD